jgi:putative transposase
VVHRVTITLNQLHQHYKERFGIETSYRMKNHCRIRTTSKNPVARLLFVALTFILVNLWVCLLWFFGSQTQRGGRVIYREFLALKLCWNFSLMPLNDIFHLSSLSIYLPGMDF